MTDLALQYDQAKRRFDLALNAAGTDLALDKTAVTAILVALGTRRRANLDDEFWESANPLQPKSLSERGGFAGDFMDPNGDLMGSRAWILMQGKLDATALAKAQAVYQEALARVAAIYGPVDVNVAPGSRGMLKVTVAVGADKVSYSEATGA